MEMIWTSWDVLGLDFKCPRISQINADQSGLVQISLGLFISTQRHFLISEISGRKNKQNTINPKIFNPQKQMKTPKNFPQTLALLCFILFISSCKTGLKPLPESVDTEVENALDRGLDGIIVCVEKEGEMTFHASGWKNKENQIPADPHALFKIASISKLYMAVAATKMVADGSLSLDQTLAELLPDHADKIEHADEISLRMLIQHRSGIPEFIDHPDFPWDNLPIANQDALAFIWNEPADFQPNKRYRYSNTNYVLLGAIMDSSLGYSHHQYIKTEILEHLQLENTFSLLSEVDQDKVMSGYHQGWEPDIKANDYSLPGGSMVATAEDVALFLRALNEGTVFEGEEQSIYSSIYRYEHTGLLPGYQSIARYHQDMDAVVIQFVNTSGGLAWTKMEKVYNRVVKILEEEN